MVQNSHQNEKAVFQNEKATSKNIVINSWLLKASYIQIKIYRCVRIKGKLLFQILKKRHQLECNIIVEQKRFDWSILCSVNNDAEYEN
jgi:hypothetical protein